VPWEDLSLAMRRRTPVRFLEEAAQDLVRRVARRTEVTSLAGPKTSRGYPGDALVHPLPVPTVALSTTGRNSEVLCLQLSLAKALRDRGVTLHCLSDHPCAFMFGIDLLPWAGVATPRAWLETSANSENARLREAVLPLVQPDLVLSSSRHAAASLSSRMPVSENLLAALQSRVAVPDFAVLVVRTIDSLEHIRSCLRILEDLHLTVPRAVVLGRSRWAPECANSLLEVRVGWEKPTHLKERRERLARELGLPTYLAQPSMAALARQILRYFAG
jgi:hypothetical protein